jgi:hypothetical protein
MLRRAFCGDDPGVGGVFCGDDSGVGGAFCGDDPGVGGAFQQRVPHSGSIQLVKSTEIPLIDRSGFICGSFEQDNGISVRISGNMRLLAKIASSQSASFRLRHLHQ